MISQSSFTLRQAFERFYRKRRLAVRTLGEWRYLLNRWERHTGDPAVHRVTPETFDAFRASAAALAPTTIETTVDKMRLILAACVQQGLIDGVPEPGDRLRVPDPRPRVCPLEALSALYRATGGVRWPNYSERVRGESGRARGGWMRWHPQTWAPAYWRTFLVVAFFTGLRLGDLFRLRAEDFDSDLLTVVAGKTGKAQAIPVHPVLRRHLNAITWARADQPFLRVGGLKQFRQTMTSLCRAAGVEQITPQRIRVLAANEWERARPRAGDAILGHSIQRRVTRFYIRPELPLELALPRLRVPEAFQTAEERAAGASRVTELLSTFERMDPESQELLLGMARRIG